MTKKELVASFSRTAGINRETADLVLHFFLRAIEEGLRDDGKLVVRGFGSFRMRKYPEIVVKDPHKHGHMKIAARSRPFFQAGKEMKERMNGAP